MACFLAGLMPTPAKSRQLECKAELAPRMPSKTPHVEMRIARRHRLWVHATLSMTQELQHFQGN